MIDETRLVRQFLQLVRIDSETGHEQLICAYLRRLFTELGLEVAVDDTAERTGHGAGNLFALLRATPGCEQADPLFFACHMDTVVPGLNINPHIDDDGYIRSDGTTILGSDDKAGIAALIECVRVLAERQIPHGAIQFIVTAGEESGLVGAHAMDARNVKAKYGYVFDSNGQVGHVVVAAPGQVKITAHVYGKMAHAGVNPEDGISAIQVASKAISRMTLGRIDHETTANIGSFEGGNKTNIVCDFVQIRAEARSISPQKLTAQAAAMRAAFEQTAAEFGAKAEVLIEHAYPGFRLDGDHAALRRAKRAIESIGLEMKTFHSGGGSDANIFNGMGIPAVNLAIGYEHIHTKEERIAVSELRKTAELAVALAAQ